ncbi:hypothetical protein SAMN02745157_1440 [Kaistia soli DSM 19436]|uniref:Uncharacterized protein n=1 Tax=Kaistia soli DSM 19436 TaxID=1122133 RepID=A0A1M4Y6G5_9HYPH|nr:hypothetical protein [Kaistia soli]SHF01404.1 hypothetical protein SAMN02745157_1440 [Kaistia soli DSM 19436]
MRHSILMKDPFAGGRMPPRLPVLTPVEKARMSGTKALVDLMAATMVERRSALNGGCTEDDLLMAGFKQAEIDAHKMAARQMAMRQVNEAA